MVAIPKRVSERLTKQITKYKKVLKRANERDVNESDTVAIITDMLGDVFGYDKYLEVTSELVIKSKYCDLAIKVKDEIKFLIEAKAIGISLKHNHLSQAVNYGANKGVPWVVLTNGINWEIHRIMFEQPIRHEPVCSFNFLELSPRKKEDHAMLFLLSKEGLSKHAIEGYHERSQAVNRFVIGAITQSPSVVSCIRRELRRMTPGLKVNEEEIQEILTNEVLKRDVVEGDEAVKSLRRVKRAAAKKTKR
jgi:hypothetical protein